MNIDYRPYGEAAATLYWVEQDGYRIEHSSDIDGIQVLAMDEVLLIRPEGIRHYLSVGQDGDYYIHADLTVPDSVIEASRELLREVYY